jgi:urocanate hydratase
VEIPLASEPAAATSDLLQIEAYGLYCSLARSTASVNAGDQESEPNLGGKLLYVGDLDAHGRAMVIAGNVAGCATLSATADSAVQKLVIRDGVVDFAVTSLDEALRILKNEVRKCATVAVCVGAAPSAVEREMIERGVLPDLVFDGLPDKRRDVPDFGYGVRAVQLMKPDAGLAFVTWQVAQAPARWMAKLDAIALDCLSSDGQARRWIRLSARYCGRSAQARRAIFCELDSAKQIVSRFAAHVQDGEIDTEVLASLLSGDEEQAFRWSPVRSA